jgi:hypothetical protein
MELQDVLALPTYHRRAFIALVASTLALLVLGDILILHHGQDVSATLSEMIGHILAGVTAAFIMTAFLSFFVPQNSRVADLVQLPATEITGAFDELLSGATRWRFKGNFGRYLRGRVLPTLARRADVDVDASIIDPRDKGLCERHARYRSEIQGIDMGREYTALDVAREALTTILHCAWQAASDNVSIDLYLTNAFDPLRVDACDGGMIVTVEDRRKPALKIGAQNFMYDHFAIHMRYVFAQGHKLDISGFRRTRDARDIIADDISTFLISIGMDGLCAEIGVEKILSDFRANRNPYED